MGVKKTMKRTVQEKAIEAINGPDIRLYKALLSDAFFVATNKSSRAAEKLEARRWLLSEDNDLLNLCAFICDVNHYDIKTRLQLIDEGKWELSRKGVI